MKKFILALILSVALLAAGCGGAANDNQPAAAPPAQAPEREEAGEIELDNPPEEDVEMDIPLSPGFGSADPLEGLVKNEYDGLTVTAAVLPRMAILPGSAVPITIEVKNNGGQALTYTQGSGSFTIPDALVVRSDDLQIAPTEDRLGVMTMDFQTKELAPGESLVYTVYAMAILPSQEFNGHAYDLFASDQEYIANLDWEDIRGRFPDLVAAAPGTYEVTVSFCYSVADGDDEFAFLLGATGYNQDIVTITITD